MMYSRYFFFSWNKIAVVKIAFHFIFQCCILTIFHTFNHHLYQKQREGSSSQYHIYIQALIMCTRKVVSTFNMAVWGKSSFCANVLATSVRPFTLGELISHEIYLNMVYIGSFRGKWKNKMFLGASQKHSRCTFSAAQFSRST